MHTRFRSFAELKASVEKQGKMPRTERPVRPLSAQVSERLWAQDVADSR